MNNFGTSGSKKIYLITSEIKFYLKMLILNYSSGNHLRIVDQNGTGKPALLRTIIEDLTPDSSTARWAVLKPNRKQKTTLHINNK